MRASVRAELRERGTVSRINRLKSVFLARSPMCCSTKAASILIVSPERSGAAKEISSSTRSITVCSRRAPMFSMLPFTATAMSAMASIASGVKSSVTPSVASSATYCLISEASGSVRMRRKSSRVSARSSTRIGKPALQLGQQVRRFRQVERARRDEQDVIGLHRAVLGRDRRAFDQRQQVALDALARHVGAGAALAAGDLVDLVQEHDAVLLDRADRLLHHLLAVEQLVGFLVDQDLVRFFHRDAPRLGAAAAELAEDVADRDRAHLRARHARNLEHRHPAAGLLDLDLDFLVVELAGAQLAAEGVRASPGSSRARPARRARAPRRRARRAHARPCACARGSA